LRTGFGDQVTQCPPCGEHLRVLAFITDPEVTGSILDHLGIASEQLVLSPARAGPDQALPELDFGC
jgi:hypothetical protein